MTPPSFLDAVQAQIEELRDLHWQECECDLEGGDKVCVSASVKIAAQLARLLRIARAAEKFISDKTLPQYLQRRADVRALRQALRGE